MPPERSDILEGRLIGKDALAALNALPLVPVADRGSTWKPPLLDLAPHPALHVDAEVADGLGGSPELHRKDNGVVVAGIYLRWGDDLLNLAGLEHPHERSCIHGIARKTIQFPAKDALRLPALDMFNHGDEAGSAGGLP